MPGPGEQAQNADVQEANANVQNQVTLEDFNENEDHVTEAKYRQKTRIDSIWYNMEYNVKNYILTFGDEFPEDQREKYGFRLTGKKDENDEAIPKSRRWKI